MGLWLFIILRIAGGVGIFLYGMNLMSLSLEKAAGRRLQSLIEVCTKNRIFALGAGTLVTMLIQSSSATTVMVVGFVNAGVMKLTQAAGVIIGANIGTTVTAQIVAFDLDMAAPVIAGLASVWYLVAEREVWKNTAQVFVGFGLLFTGIVFLKEAMGVLGEQHYVVEILSRFDGTTVFSYIILLLFGAIITIMVQSSSTVTGIMVAMAAQGLLGMSMAVPLILGSNLGTTFTAVLASIGTNINAKRAACIHVIFNVCGVVIFMLVLQNPTIEFVNSVSGSNMALQIANFHTAFNVLTAIVMLPLIGSMVKATTRFLS